MQVVQAVVLGLARPPVGVVKVVIYVTSRVKKSGRVYLVPVHYADVAVCRGVLVWDFTFSFLGNEGAGGESGSLRKAMALRGALLGEIPKIVVSDIWQGLRSFLDAEGG